MNITLDFGTLYGKVSRSLSIIGKRITDDQGNRLFQDITLGSREKELMSDYFTNAFVDLCAELQHFITAEIQNVSGLTSIAYLDWWTNQTAASLASSITRDGQLLYKYDTHQLYVSDISYPFDSVTPEADTLFTYNDNYYIWDETDGLVQLTAEQITEYTEEQLAEAIVITYNGTDPTTISETASGVYAYYDGSMYVSNQVKTFSENTPDASTMYISPTDEAYQWLYGTMQRVEGGIASSITLTLTMPDNWRDSLFMSLRTALYNYCVAYALYSWFTITDPDIAEKYQGDSQRQLASVIRFINEKKAPDNVSSSYYDVNGSIS